MGQDKKWIKNEELKYSFEVAGKVIGNLTISYANFDRKAFFEIEDKKYTLEYNGFWSSSITVKDENEAVVLRSYTEKWYANSSILEYKGQKFRLKIRNNPLAEYVIFDENQNELLAYGLKVENHQCKVVIHSNGSIDYLFDFLLWYSFLPIAQENMGDSFVFQTLLMT
ncbi:hypothetical protein BXU11_12780 [Flavobacterium sp. LM5]|uniref:hypothetical protein n=1 Tax=Flavobacterium sp. LM5 TaxID=1938610 RepID=UPI000992E875|nr:hypothetical protein [Flavobacterium sp. LM5]OOV26357.1 hypothetical protein BXU11_12780 [Flavobacterium sp. LM5]